MLINNNEEPFNYIDRFCTPWARGKARKYSVFILLMFIYVEYIIIKEFLITNFFEGRIFFDGIFAVIGGIVIVYLLILHIYLFINMWLVAYDVEIYNDNFICYNAFGKEIKRIFYKDVLEIKKTYPNMAGNMKIVTTKCKIQIWGGINRYGECIENIRKRSVNLKLVDYGGLDSSKIWTRNDEKFEGQP